MSPDYLTIEEAAQYLRVSARTVYRRIWNGDLPAARFGGMYRISKQDLDDLLQGKSLMRPKFEDPAPAARLKCSQCYKLLDTTAQQQATTCAEPGCTALVCADCRKNNLAYCKTHTPTDTERWQRAQQRFARREIPVLVQNLQARLLERNYTQRMLIRLSQYESIQHPFANALLSVRNWDACLTLSEEREQMMHILNTPALQTDLLARNPRNTRLVFNLPLPKGAHLPALQIHIQVLSRLNAMLKDGFDTAPLNLEDINARIEALHQHAESEDFSAIVVFASVTGWDAQFCQRDLPKILHRRILWFFYDMQTQQLHYQPHNVVPNAAGYAELLRPNLPEEELNTLLSELQNELLMANSLALSAALRAFPAVREPLMRQAFERLATSGKYTLIELPEDDDLALRHSQPS
ncbi:MAG: hypothetical protein OHK0052_07000 [Anaerolineales bacterium]